jgi:hypothetical protein
MIPASKEKYDDLKEELKITLVVKRDHLLNPTHSAADVQEELGRTAYHGFLAGLASGRFVKGESLLLGPEPSPTSQPPNAATPAQTPNGPAA